MNYNIDNDPFRKEETVFSETSTDSTLQILYDNQRKIEKISCQDKIIFPKPIISRNGIGIIYPNDIITIQGKKGSHKSRLAEHICSILLGENVDILAYEKDFDKKIDVLYIDTERNMNHQFPFAIQKIKEMAGFNRKDTPINFTFTSLVNIGRESRLKSILKYLENFTSGDSTAFKVVFIDVLTDLIANYNDVTESMLLIDSINDMINRYNCTFICVIHENPNEATTKMRGTVGTELGNKASTSIQIGYERNEGLFSDTARLKVSYLKNRMTAPQKAFYVKYCNDFKGLILDSDFEVKPRTNPKQELADFLTPLLVAENLNVEDIYRVVCERFNVSRKSAEVKWKEFKEVSQRTFEYRNYTLCFEVDGRNRAYFFKEIDLATKYNLASDLPT